MITLTNEYQYIGRSSGVKAAGSNWYYYFLLYAKTKTDPATGKQDVTVKMRLACNVNSTFYKYNTSASLTVAGVTAFSWSSQKIPGSAWNSTAITEDGVKYPRWIDLKEGTVTVNTAYDPKEITIAASWKREAISGSPPTWLPLTTKITASINVMLPAVELPEDPEPDEPEPDDPKPVAVPEGIRIYADGTLVYDSRLEDQDLVGLKVTHGLNVGGTAELVMPLGHPAYNSFAAYKTIVTIYRDGVLRFRGRVLYAADNFYGQRTVTCEGEMCLLRDTINRPYSYEASPRSIFVTILNAHNAATDPEKRFTVGKVTVTDPNEYIKMENESAETTMDTLNKLIDRCGGFITFTTNSSGNRVINYLASLGSTSNQVIEFGENLLDFSRTGANSTGIITGLVPFGAKDEKTKKRITIASVNDGKDYILADDAVAVRGIIMGTEVWNDVTTPANLLKKAKAHLEEHKSFVTSITLTALDLSYLDRSLDSFAVGDMVRVVSAPHGVDEKFQLSQLTEDLLNPARSTITLGKDIQSLTGYDVAGDNKSQKELDAVKVEYEVDLDGITEAVGTEVLEQASLIYVPQDAMAALEEELSKTDETLLQRIIAEENARAAAAQSLQTAINNEANTRAGVINKVSGVVHISGGAPINMLGGKIDINGSEINFGKEIRFPNGLGVRIADKDGNFYYVLRVDDANSCVVGNDYTNLYLRGKDAVYLYKTGAVVTSDRREKNSAEGLSEAYMAMLDKLTPMRFKYNGKGDRYHVGFIAQDVEAALTGAGLTAQDFGGFVDLNGDGSHLGLAYDEFIGLLLEKIRRLEQRIDEMEAKV